MYGDKLEYKLSLKGATVEQWQIQDFSNGEAVSSLAETTCGESSWRDFPFQIYLFSVFAQNCSF